MAKKKVKKKKAKKVLKKKTQKEKTRKKRAVKKKAARKKEKAKKRTRGRKEEKVLKDVEKKITETAKGSGTTHSFSYSTVKTKGTRFSTVKGVSKGCAISIRGKKR